MSMLTYVARGAEANLRTLGQATPLTYLASEAGARLVEDMLYRIDSGFFA